MLSTCGKMITYLEVDRRAAVDADSGQACSCRQRRRTYLDHKAQGLTGDPVLTVGLVAVTGSWSPSPRHG